MTITEIKIMTININCLRSMTKRLLFEAKLTVENFDVIILTETCWDNNITPGMTQFANYNVASRADRTTDPNPKKYGGGTAILVKKSIKFHSPSNYNVNDYGQVAAVKIKDLQIVGVYRKPSNNKTLDKKLADLVVNKFTADNLVLMGDINLPKTDWLNSIHPSRPSKMWKNVKAEMNLTQHVHETTHNKGNALDLLFARSTSNDVIRNVIVDKVLFEDMSDHYCVSANIKIVILKEVEKKEVYNVKRIDWDQFKESTKNKHMVPKVARVGNENEKWAIIYDSLFSAREETCPKIKITEGNGPRWVSETLRLQLKKAQRYRKMSLLPAIPSVKKKRLQSASYHQRKVKSQVIDARIKYETSQIMADQKNPRELFNNMKRAKNVIGSSPPLNDVNGNPLKSDVDKANALQDRFLRVFTPLDNTPINWYENWGLNHIQFTPAKVKLAIKNMNPSASAGGDEIGPKFFKGADLSLVFALADLYQYCFDNTVMPNGFLESKVIALWKQKGAISDLQMYRAITIGNTGYKVKEIVMLKEIDDHLEAHDLFDNWQHGFQKGKSIITNLMGTWEFISSEVDRGESWCTLSLDFQAAFDSISIYHLLLALQKRGIGGKLGKFIEYWLKNRTQYVVVNGERSRIEGCSSGICQGSISGPRFFSTLLSDVFGKFENDLSNLNVKLWCFADDSRLIFQSRNLMEAQKFQELLWKMNEEFRSVGLKLNASKSVMVKYGLRNIDFCYKVDGVEIPVKNESLELGCIMSDSMKFNSQLEKNVKKALSVLFLIRNTFKVRNYLTLKRLYNTYYVPILLFSVQIWMNPQKGTQDLLYKMFRKFWYLGEGNIVPGDEIQDPYQLAVKHCLTFMYQMINRNTCLEPDDFITFKSREITRSDRKVDIDIERSYHVYRSNFFTINIAHWYNKLTPEIRNAPSVESFKSKLVGFLKIDVPTPPMNFTPYHKR